MSIQDEVAAVERNLKQSKKTKELGASYERLCKNKDFMALIKEAYFKDEAVRLVHLRGDPAFQTAEKQASILTQMDAIAGLNSFFLNVMFQANLAQKDIEEGEVFLEDAANEGSN